MRIAGDGPKPHFMTEVGVLFRNDSFIFTVVTMDNAFRDALQTRLARVGGKLLRFRPWEVTLGFCPGQRVTITQKHTTEAEHKLWHADGRPFNYLDVEVTVPACSDAFDGALGQTYQCKYVQGGADFEWSHEQEEAFRLPGGLLSASGVFDVDASCFDDDGKGLPQAAAVGVATGKKGGGGQVASRRGKGGKDKSGKDLLGSSTRDL
jgi:hypothetical protein